MPSLKQITKTSCKNFMGDTMTADTGFEMHGTAEKRIELSKKTIETLLAEYPFIEDFFAENRLTELYILNNTQRTFDSFLQSLSETQCEDYALDR